MGVVLIKWAWLKNWRALRARLYLQPHHSKNPRSAPEWLFPMIAMSLSLILGMGSSGLHCGRCCRVRAHTNGVAQGHWYHPDGREYLYWSIPRPSW